MKFFSGFSFKNEDHLFEQYLNYSKFSVAGFSYGSILAFEYVLNSESRVDSLQLFSPAFFQGSSDKFVRTQLFHFKKDRNKYIQIFSENSFFPNEVSKKLERKDDEYSDLEKLLNYRWKKEDIQKVLEKGIKIEIFLGGKDKIIDSKKAFEFFKEFGETYFIKDVGHTLS